MKRNAEICLINYSERNTAFFNKGVIFHQKNKAGRLFSSHQNTDPRESYPYLVDPSFYYREKYRSNLLCALDVFEGDLF